MIDAAHFIDQATAAGFDFYAGVPCSFLTPLINRVIGDRSLSYFGATSEGEAIGIAAGAWLAGRSPVVMCQNSGLGNMNAVFCRSWREATFFKLRHCLGSQPHLGLTWLDLTGGGLTNVRYR